MKREREAPEIGAMSRRVFRALVRRAGAGDVEALRELVALQGELAAAITDAGRAMHDDAGFSFTYLAAETGVTRQAARKRYGAGRKVDQVDDVDRRDRYTVTVEGHTVRATVSQEQRIREMDDVQRARFVRIMGRA